jgi:hypothetical protein
LEKKSMISFEKLSPQLLGSLMLKFAGDFGSTQK